LVERVYLAAKTSIPAEDTRLILSLRLLIARAANKDSLAWWDDDSLADHTVFLLDRIFPIAPRLAGRSLALRAAVARHQVAVAAEERALHLFRLDTDNEDELAARQMELATIPMPEQPISTMGELRTQLMELTGEPATFRPVRQTMTRGLLIELPAAPAGVSVWRHRAQALAWAYLEGAHSQPVFPFILE